MDEEQAAREFHPPPAIVARMTGSHQIITSQLVLVWIDARAMAGSGGGSMCGCASALCASFSCWARSPLAQPPTPTSTPALLPN
eukprot:m.475337 g.475337  ORF g.475337 m.475337 type:complete len:84 (+) comp38122_c0_seq1:1-252(+)